VHENILLKPNRGDGCGVDVNKYYTMHDIVGKWSLWKKTRGDLL
jgi:hypothetical protein